VASDRDRAVTSDNEGEPDDAQVVARRRSQQEKRSVLRLCGAVALDIYDEWASVERRNFSEVCIVDLFLPLDDNDATCGGLVPTE
jgi:hypothetical protein